MEKNYCVQSCATLEERDYIGLSEALSVTDMKSQKVAESLPAETDLQLELGLGLTIGSNFKRSADNYVAEENLGIKIPEVLSLNQKNGVKRGFSDVSQHTCQNPSLEASGQSSATENAPSSKDRVVGWPPVRLYRRQSLSKAVENFVKVNMDGVTVGRKVDLNAYKSYDGLLGALEEMFRPLQSGKDGEVKPFLLSSEPGFVLTYEDKDGDWMLVGDVPWSMFTSSVNRLRITRLEVDGTGK
ncbi:hypothetical protein KP509_11G002000 [Ceratopteris richardii]|uniref:Auxin-responsive protein n=1 Tax=Ceratopteris richardii TaxID=49495 RepID=A0A8T2TPD4_CERRI|nr:hypothetical protein KP509_11G002000 [Ceratopteris richardii]